MSSPDTTPAAGDDPTLVIPRQDLMPTPQPAGVRSPHGSDIMGWVPPLPEEMAALFPAFEILSILGRGGMGAVYLARDRKLERLVALKLLPPELGGEASYVERFMREAKALARLDHQNIVHIYAFDQTAAGHLYFIMEYVEGLDLHQLIRRNRAENAKSQNEPPLPYATTLEIIGRICDALQYAHDKGIIHRDIKPANVIVAADGRVKVADFGLARPAELVGEMGAMTQTGAVMGTPDYMAPEQRDGQPADHRADIYALGVMFYELLTGSIPRGAFPPPSRRASVDARLDEVVLKALQSEPELRYQHASEIKTDVQRIQTTPPPKAPAAKKTPRAEKPKPPPKPPEPPKPAKVPNYEAPVRRGTPAKPLRPLSPVVREKWWSLLRRKPPVVIPQLTNLPPRIRPGAPDPIPMASPPPPVVNYSLRIGWMVAGALLLLAGLWWALS